MEKQEFKKYLENVDREDKANYVISYGGLGSELLETEVFVKSFSPWELAKIIKESDLTLGYSYVRTAVYYYDFTEADAMEDLVTDDEIDDFFDDVEPDDYEGILIELGA